MKANRKSKVEVAAYFSPSMEIIRIEPCAICQTSGDGTHEGLGYDDDGPIFGNE